jgi:hypothetical protein
MNEDKKYAKVCWQIEDILSLRPEWTDEKCEEFLINNSRIIADMMVERGWQAIEDLLDE